MTKCSRTLRPAVVLLAAVAAAAATGCSSDGGSSPGSPPTTPAAASSTRGTPASQEPRPEPSPVISYLGRTKIVTVGDVEIRATRNEAGFVVACNVTNTADTTRNIRVKVSIGDGEEWVTTNEFDFRRVPAGRAASESTVMGASRSGDLPDDPKIYIDSVIPY